MANFIKTTPGAACDLVDAVSAAWGYVGGIQEAYLSGELVAFKDATGWYVSKAFAGEVKTAAEIEGERLEALEDIASKVLDIKTLAPQGSDRLDFHDVAVWTLKAALNAAFEAGQKERMA
ncbi:DUF6900 domain-containing protein [Tritonibacter mobilis]|uniref:DUF6900 domain-containing protein n=1 Tax=Tritonibacter mobilis TaxID=379347 RepID=UPI000806D227|nr:hypothetical protein [Tritonibacter mobilis]MBU3035945.1 hypothetical protein [Tritonibacter mobilis]WHQ85375.1 hypothetical protein OMR53_21795 [Tritonibacter mobilis]